MTDSKGTDHGWAYETHRKGNKIINRNNENLIITGFDTRCGHNNGYAYETMATGATCY